MARTNQFSCDEPSSWRVFGESPPGKKGSRLWRSTAVGSPVRPVRRRAPFTTADGD
jgi:hypothetical protein